MLRAPPSERELASVGLTLADVEADLTVDLWPENADAVSVFTIMYTQWRMGPGGPIGLDYNVLPMASAAAGVSAPIAVLLGDIRALESETLKFFAARAEERAQNGH